MVGTNRLGADASCAAGDDDGLWFAIGKGEGIGGHVLVDTKYVVSKCLRIRSYVINLNSWEGGYLGGLQRKFWYIWPQQRNYYGYADMELVEHTTDFNTCTSYATPILQ